MASREEQDLAALIGALPPVPEAWVGAAKALPRSRRGSRAPRAVTAHEPALKRGALRGRGGTS